MCDALAVSSLQLKTSEASSILSLCLHRPAIVDRRESRCVDGLMYLSVIVECFRWMSEVWQLAAPYRGDEHSNSGWACIGFSSNLFSHL